MTQRLDIATESPEGYRAVLGLERHLSKALDPALYHLIELRASIINGCAFCVDMHSRDALQEGETTQRLFGVAAWRDAPFYTDRERAALALTDAVTRLGEDGVSDEVWDEVAAVWKSNEIADLLIAIATINVWNRIAIPTRKQPPLR